MSLQNLPGVPLAKVLLLLEAGRTRGVWPEAWCASAGVSRDGVADVDLAEARVPAASVVALWEALVAATDDPAFPLDVARRMRLEAYDVYGFAVLTSPDVGTALTRAARFFSLTGNPGSLAVRSRRRRGARHPRARRSRRDPAGRPLRGGVRPGAGGPHRPRGAARPGDPARRHLRPRAAARSSAAHDRFFGVPVAFDAAAHELVFDRDLLARPLAPVDRSLSAFYEHHAARLLRAVEAPVAPTSVAAVRGVLLAGAFDAPPELAEVARRLGVGERTLRRRLAEAGVSFRALRDDVLRERALELLRRPGSAIAEVAFVLGFSDPTAFHRAFRRWTGVTPQAWRRGERA